jgi:anti-sigma factor RsiW
VNCNQVDNLIVDYLYGELDPDGTREFEAHLDVCAACAERVGEYRWVLQNSAGRPDPAPSTMTVNRILAVAREEAEKPRSFRRLSWLKILAPVCVMGIVGGIILFQYQSGLLSRQALAPREEIAVEKAPSPSAPEPSPPAVAETPPRPVFRGAGPTVMTEEAPDKAVTDETGPAEEAKPRNIPAETEPSPEASTEPSMEPGEQARAALDPANRSTGGTVASRVAPQRTTRGLTLGDDTAESPTELVCRSLDDAEVTKAVPADPELTAWLASRMTEARVAMDSGEYERAGQVFQAVLHRLPEGHKDRATALLWLAQVYEKLGHREKALQTYRLLALECPERKELAEEKVRELAKE